MDVTGGPPGTGRSTSSSSPREDGGERSFEADLDSARRAERREERRGERTERAHERHGRLASESRGRSARAAGQSEQAGPQDDPAEANRAQAPRQTPSTVAGEEAALTPQVEAGADPQAEAVEAESAASPRTARGAQPQQAAAKPSLPQAAVEAQLASPTNLPTSDHVPQGRATAGSSPALPSAPADANPLGNPSDAATSSAAAAAPSAETEPAPTEGRFPDPLAGDEAQAREPARADAGRAPTVERAPGHEPAAQDGARVREAAPRAEAARSQAPHVAQHEQAADILRQVRLQLSPQLRQASIQLEPASLGRLDIRLEVRRGRVRAELSVERAETLQVLERHAPELRASLAAAGFDQAELSLSLAQQDGRPDQGPTSRGARSAARTALEPAPPALQNAVARRLAHDGAVDTYA